MMTRRVRNDVTDPDPPHHSIVNSSKPTCPCYLFHKYTCTANAVPSVHLTLSFLSGTEAFDLVLADGSLAGGVDGSTGAAEGSITVFVGAASSSVTS